MRVLVAALFIFNLLMGSAFAQRPDRCEVPGYLLFGDSELKHVSKAVKDKHQLNIVIMGTGSSTLAGPDGNLRAYPARLEAALKSRLPNVDTKVSTHAAARQTAASMAVELTKILTEEKPTLIVWQTGTVDAMRGVEPDEFGAVVNDGVEKILAAGADVILMNMQYSPRTDTMIAASPYAENLRWVSQQRNVPLFDRLGIMRHWSDTGIFDFHTPTKAFVVAQRVHECIGRALATQIIDAAQLGPMTAKVAP
jgi:hypothetical protein